MLDRFEIIVLSLERRADRRRRCDEILRGYDYRYYLTRENHSDLWGNASRDYLKMLSTIEDDYAIVFEDDFELKQDGTFEKAWDQLPDNFDLLYLGANLTTAPQRYSQNLLKLNGAWTVHALVYSRKFINFALNNYDYATCGVYDEWLRNMARQRDFYMTYPMIAWQRPDYSDFVRSDVNYDLFNNQYYTEL